MAVDEVIRQSHFPSKTQEQGIFQRKVGGVRELAAPPIPLYGLFLWALLRKYRQEPSIGTGNAGTDIRDCLWYFTGLSVSSLTRP
jgi:hypothetical protein